MTRALLKQALEALSRPRPQNSFYQRACDDADVAKAIRAYLYEQPMQVAQRITAMQALEALDELESSARGDEPFNHASAPLIRAFIEGSTHRAQPQGEPVAMLETTRRYCEYEGSEKVDSVGHLFTTCVGYGRQDKEGHVLLYTRPAHTEAEVQEIMDMVPAMYEIEETVRRILGVPKP